MGEEAEDEEECCSVLVLTPKNRSWRESRASKAVVVLGRLPLLLLVVLVGNKSLLCTRLVVVVVVVHARIGGIHIIMKQLQSNMPTTTPRLLSRRCRR